MRRLFIALVLGLPAAAPTSPLLEAASTDDRAAALQSLANGADARAKLDDGTTALHYAAHFGNLDLAQRLIKAGADARARNDYGSTPMQEAAERGDPALIRLLLKAGADANTANDEGETALMTVARTDRADVGGGAGQSGDGAPADQVGRKSGHHLGDTRLGSQGHCRTAAAESSAGRVHRAAAGRTRGLRALRAGTGEGAGRHQPHQPREHHAAA